MDTDLVEALRKELERQRATKYAQGEIAYGSYRWLSPDGASFGNIQEELVDLMNWAELFWMKLELLRRAST